MNAAILRIGTTVTTPGIDELLKSKALRHDDLIYALRRHASGDWGDVPDEDWEENNRSLAAGYSILSAYTDRLGIRFWIITEGDRSVTTILLPDEY